VTERIERALQAIRSSLQPDGFDLKIKSFENGVVSLIVLAGPEACQGCLLPQEHMQLRLKDRLRASLAYTPRDTGGSDPVGSVHRSKIRKNRNPSPAHSPVSNERHDCVTR
jgi:Fe-S cluster biogenesis protein NfuA